jgi:hypothetical protein
MTVFAVLVQVAMRASNAGTRDGSRLLGSWHRVQQPGQRNDHRKQGCNHVLPTIYCRDLGSCCVIPALDATFQPLRLYHHDKTRTWSGLADRTRHLCHRRSVLLRDTAYIPPPGVHPSARRRSSRDRRAPGRHFVTLWQSMQWVTSLP